MAALVPLAVGAAAAGALFGTTVTAAAAAGTSAIVGVASGMAQVGVQQLN